MSEHGPSATAAHGGIKLPAEPYPGLRPFLDFEASLLFGRERQVREVIERMRDTHFVAVIGGSGSGKSSLILAGVVPELRSFGIPGAGDFWLSMVCTPGTNVAQVDQAKRLNSPLTRMAWKFAALLRSRGSAEADAARLDEIAACLREEVGFSRIIDRYTSELAAPPGPDPREARFLFVVDQFEELFHPTNRNVEDCRLLVERIIDHFFSPHPRCYVVLTMRSEHLNDCAGYLELPDAINKASYLVRRLDRDELRSAIVDPARRLLRLRQRGEDDTARLPASVEFESAVTERLLRDVQAITGDPDHLPLLQHLLARVWQAALERVKDRLDLPDLITAADLAKAVGASAPATEAALDGRVNLLRLSLENWAEALYQRHDTAERGLIDAVLRHLAVKDPNTGMYSQQRINVDDNARFLGAGKTRADLHALIRQGFLGEVDYLFWDDENPARVTLKVSHESFIRGWAHFRQVVDAEADRFEKFVDLLLKCSDWVRSEHDDAFLLEAGDLRRMSDASLEPMLADATEREAWFRFLLQGRDGARLARLEPEVDRFVAASVERQRAARQRDSLRRLAWRAVAVGLLLAVPPLLFWTVVQGPVLSRTALMFKAGSVAGATPIPQPPNYPAAGSAAPALKSLLDAAAALDTGRWGGGPMAATNRLLLDRLSGFPFVRPQAEFLERVAAGAEPAVNGSLRQVLESAVWLMPKVANEQTGKGGQKGEKLLSPDATLKAGCDLVAPPSRISSSTSIRRPGRLFTATNPVNPKFNRSIFVPDMDPGDTVMEVRSAAVDAAGGCRSAQEILRIPRFLEPDLVIDANLRHVMHTAADNAAGTKTVALYEIDWELTDAEGGRLVRKIPRVVLTGAEAAEQVTRSARLPNAAVPAVPAVPGPPGVAILDTWRMPAGRAMAVDGRLWRIFTSQAQRVSNGDADTRLRPLAAALQGSACAELGARLQARSQRGFETVMFDQGAKSTHCVAVARGRPPDASDKTDQVVVAVYAKPQRDAIAGLEAALPAPVASLPRFTRVKSGAALQWWVGASDGELAGWVAALGPDNNGQLRHIAAPWSTCALWRLGSEVLAQQPGQGGTVPGGRDDKVCSGR